VDAGTSVTVWRARPGGAEVTDATRAAWSPDGSRIAFWTHACIEGDVGACTRGQSSLHVLDPFDGAESIVAVAHGDTAGEYLAFSPDGARIAYVFGGMIYSVPAP
jgi:Tol biopolymer transport system component